MDEPTKDDAAEVLNEDEGDATELLVEEVSIDGLCVVY